MNEKNLTLEEINTTAIENHQKGNLKTAENLYKKILKKRPNVHTQNNLGALYLQTGEKGKAMSLLQDVLKIEPNNVNANENLGVAYNKLLEYRKAIECHKKVIQINPNQVPSDTYNNLAINYEQLGELELAKSYYNKAIEINPNNVNAYNSLGTLFLALAEHEKAINAFKKALQIQPNFLKAQANIANAYTNQLNQIEKAITESYKTLSIHHKISKINDEQIAVFRLKHDVQQAGYLKSKNCKINGIDEFNEVGNEILNRSKNKADINLNEKILLKENEIKSLLPFYKADYVYPVSDIHDGCINPHRDWSKVEMEYLNSKNQIIYIDNFLSEKALNEMREFCLISKVWYHQYPNNKYLGAFSDTGFISQIHLQIAIELKEKLPKLFGKYDLGKFWGFKYDTTLGKEKGIGIHADFAYLNLNFWITPDEYNNDKNRGGLKVYDAPAPEDWSFAKYNSSAKEIFKFLDEKKAKCVNIPYKFNRAVLFNSAYFHETDKINFKDGYEKRRINITYLFGSRPIRKTS